MNYANVHEEVQCTTKQTGNCDGPISQKAIISSYFSLPKHCCLPEQSLGNI